MQVERNRKAKGDLAELKVAADLRARGYRIAFPYGDTAKMIDWLAVWDRYSNQCFYIPAVELGDGMALIHLRPSPSRNGQLRGVRPAANYMDI